MRVCNLLIFFIYVGCMCLCRPTEQLLGHSLLVSTVGLSVIRKTHLYCNFVSIRLFHNRLCFENKMLMI